MSNYVTVSKCTLLFGNMLCHKVLFGYVLCHSAVDVDKKWLLWFGAPTGHLWNEMPEKSSKQDQAWQNQKWGDTRHGRSKTSPTAHQTTTGQVVRTHHTYAYKPTRPPGIQHQVLQLESERKTKKTMELLRGRHPQNSRDVPSPGHPPCCWQTAVSPRDAYRYKRRKKVKVK